jgi:hypothetical protein
MRAASLDASLLDTELTGLLTAPLHAALKFFHVPTLSSCFLSECDANSTANVCIQLRSRACCSAQASTLESRYLGQQCVLWLINTESALSDNSYVVPLLRVDDRKWNCRSPESTTKVGECRAHDRPALSSQQDRVLADPLKRRLPRSMERSPPTTHHQRRKHILRPHPPKLLRIPPQRSVPPPMSKKRS